MDWSSGLENVIVIILSLWIIVCNWKIFVKAWEWWWKSIIPVYNMYILCKIVNHKGWFWVIMLLPIIWIIWMIVSLISWVLMNSWSPMAQWVMNLFNWILWMCSMLAMIATFVFGILIQVYLWKVFWKWPGFCVGLVLLNFVFLWILAFDDSKYDLNNLESSSEKQKTQSE
jgi:hypothetical protein